MILNYFAYQVHLNWPLHAIKSEFKNYESNSVQEPTGSPWIRNIECPTVNTVATRAYSTAHPPPPQVCVDKIRSESCKRNRIENYPDNSAGCQNILFIRRANQLNNQQHFLQRNRRNLNLDLQLGVTKQWKHFRQELFTWILRK